MSIKKYSSGSWVTVPYRKYETATDTITSLPQTIIGDGQPISSYTIKGNMSQSGTPTPSNPVYPTECGDKTANLWNVTIMPNSSITEQGRWEKYDESITSTTMYMPCEGNMLYVLTTPNSITSGIFRVYTSISDDIPVYGGVSVPVYEKIRSASPVSQFAFRTGAGAKMLIVQVLSAN